MVFVLQAVRYSEGDGALTTSLASLAACKRLELLDVVLPDKNGMFLSVDLAPEFESELFWRCPPPPPVSSLYHH